jgi:hypothetical protein
MDTISPYHRKGMATRKDDFLDVSPTGPNRQGEDCDAVLVLNARETAAFVELLLCPQPPGPVLRSAAKRYKKALELG